MVGHLLLFSVALRLLENVGESALAAVLEGKIFDLFDFSSDQIRLWSCFLRSDYFSHESKDISQNRSFSKKTDLI